MKRAKKQVKRTTVREANECMGCMYRSVQDTCDFAIVTGVCRSTICAAGPECTVRVDTVADYYKAVMAYTTGSIPLPPADRKQTDGRRKIDEGRAWRLYLCGLNDKEIAAELRVGQMTVMNWRHRNELPHNRKKVAG